MGRDGAAIAAQLVMVGKNTAEGQAGNRPRVVVRVLRNKGIARTSSLTSGPEPPARCTISEGSKSYFLAQGGT
jgi:hypothetical protein